MPSIEPPDASLPTLPARIKTLLIGKPRDLHDQSIFRHVSLVAFLAWVGLGADGLSSSCYGPPEAFEHLVKNGVAHHYLAVFLALATILTVFIISSCYSHIIEEFPSGGGGYLVASKLLGRRVGVVSGCALLVDYVLTITTSVAAAGDALFGLARRDFGALGFSHQETMMIVEGGTILLLIVLNMRTTSKEVGHAPVADLLDLSADAYPHHQWRDRNAFGQRRRRCVGDFVEGAGECPQSVGRHLGHAWPVSLRLLDGRRHVYRHRSRLQQHAGDARAARANRQAHHALYGHVAGDRRRRTDDFLSPLGNSRQRRKRQDHEPAAGHQSGRRRGPARQLARQRLPC